MCAELDLKLQSSLLTLKSEISKMIWLKKKSRQAPLFRLGTPQRPSRHARTGTASAAAVLGPWGSLGTRLVGLPELGLQAQWGAPLLAASPTNDGEMVL